MLIQLRPNGAHWVHAEHIKVIRIKNNVVMVTMKDGRRYRLWPELPGETLHELANDLVQQVNDLARNK